jgi:hypothetical protein
MMKNLIVFLLCLLLFIGCSGKSDDGDATSDSTDTSGTTGGSTGDTSDDTSDGSDDDSSSLTGYNNYAVFTHSNFGRGETDNSILHKAVNVTVINDNGFSLSNTYVNRYSESSNSVYWMFTITNGNSGAYCYVELSDIVFYNGNNAIADDSLSFIQGSVGKSSSGYCNDTCLAPGESGIAWGIEYDIYSDVTDVRIGSIEYNTRSTYSDPLPRVLPQSYTASSDSSGVNVEIVVKNEGSYTASLSSSYYYLLDSDGSYLDWGILSSPSDSILVENESVTFPEESIYYYGTAVGLQVFVDYDESSVSNLSTLIGLSGRLTPDERKHAFLEAREARIILQLNSH